MQQHQLRDDNSNTAEPALAEEKMAEHRAIEENTESVIKLEELVTVKQITAV